MEIVPIYSPYIFSIQYDEQEENEYDRLFDLWNDVSYVIKFFDDNKEFLNNETWKNIKEPEAAAAQVINEAEQLENLFEELFENTKRGDPCDFESHFKYFEGKYKYTIKLIPVKSYGIEKPSLLRLYAIRLEENAFLITGGGIKLADTIQNSPDLKDHVIQNIDIVRNYLLENGILDREDIINQ